MIHNILIQKLEHHGVRGICKNDSVPMKQKDNKQFVSTDKCNARTKTILTVVSQGSVLRPVLFLINKRSTEMC